MTGIALACMVARWLRLAGFLSSEPIRPAGVWGVFHDRFHKSAWISPHQRTDAGFERRIASID